MSDCVKGIAQDAAGAQTTCISLDDAMGARRFEVAQHSSFADIASRAMGHATTRPSGQQDFMVTERQALFGPAGDAVGDAKLDVLSNVERPGANTRDTQAEEADNGQELEDRVRSLYFDLTNYQVAWKIAQRIQQDTSQLLRGQ